MGVGLGAGMAMGKQMADAMTPGPGAAPVAPNADTAFCAECGKPIPRASKFCPECGAKRL
jgi:membrane protease subunit (stomatin/prohibitin family)